MTTPNTKTNSYAEAGVSIDRGNQLVEHIKPFVKETQRPGVMGNLGGFAALFDMSALDYRQPVLVSGTDGVGTKLKLVIESGIFDTIGIDLVAMCVNDLLVHGAEPLFFLDYYACSSLDVAAAAQVIQGIAEGCKRSGCALSGGETAEMPGMYQFGEFDLAGFCVGVVEKDEIIDGSDTAMGDAVIAIASSGPHSNGYSLIRKVLSDSSTKLSDKFAAGTFTDVLLQPTRIYIKPVLGLLKAVRVKAISHITGGGLLENIPRILPAGVQVQIDCNSWQWPAIFKWLMNTGNIPIEEMYRTFNCGIGLVLIVKNDDADKTIKFLHEQGEQAWLVGRVAECSDNKNQIRLINKDADKESVRE